MSPRRCAYLTCPQPRSRNSVWCADHLSEHLIDSAYESCEGLTEEPLHWIDTGTRPYVVFLCILFTLFVLTQIGLKRGWIESPHSDPSQTSILPTLTTH